MKKPIYLILALFATCLLSSCQKTEAERLERLLQKWYEKEITFPKNPSFTVYGEKESDFTIPKDGYKLVHYVDSVGCTSCKLNLDKWQEYIAYLDSVTVYTVPCLFFIHATQKREVKIALKNSRFDYPVCLDVDNEFYRLNKFPMHPMLQTFLLDKNNRIVGMGDPVKNPRVKEFYLNLISGKRDKQEMEQSRTTARLSHQEIDFGTFPWEMKKDTVVTLTNIGTQPLVIHDIATSCGCTVANYDKQPARPGESLKIQVSFKADRPEYFNKNIIIHCNTGNSPYVIWVKGHAKK